MTRWNDRIIKRMTNEVMYFMSVDTPTLRSCQQDLGIPKSTTFVDLTRRFRDLVELPEWKRLDILPEGTWRECLVRENYNYIRFILDTNLLERADRGGKSTKRKLQAKKELLKNETK